MTAIQSVMGRQSLVTMRRAFVAQPGEACVGVVATDSFRKVMFMAWQVVPRRADAAEAEAHAAMVARKGDHRIGLCLLKEDWSERGFIIAEARKQLRMLVESPAPPRCLLQSIATECEGRRGHDWHPGLRCRLFQSITMEAGAPIHNHAPATPPDPVV
ncbi:hypothetical protein HU200_061140 [Digitaria exilis]|uniref:Uncharacterized protein n=1 Tax=Digitaria exilis TaxID=1010633 RepID=A0A835AD12_9POAL|nr:hypothetical protein HU200_061140 [Digitaria exilis]